MDEQVNKAERIPRQQALTYNTKSSCTRVPLVLTYHPSLEPLRKILRQTHPILSNDEDLKTLFPQPPLLSFKQPPNLRNKLIRSSATHPTTPNGTFPCQYPRCMTCANIRQGSSITIRGITHHIDGHFTCEATGVIYMITCNNPSCTSIFYIGETGQMLRRRMNGHRHSITSEDATKPVGAQFSQNGHSIDNLLVTILKGNQR